MNQEEANRVIGVLRTLPKSRDWLMSADHAGTSLDGVERWKPTIVAMDETGYEKQILAAHTAARELGRPISHDEIGVRNIPVAPKLPDTRFR